MVQSTTTTISEPVDTDNITDLTDEAIAELFKGAPDDFSDPGPETVPVDTTQVGTPAASLGTVMLTNIRHRQEEIHIPDPVTHTWSGRKAVFVDHRLVTDPITATFVKAACPYVYEENLSAAPEAWMSHPETRFRTTNAQGYAEYTRIWAEDK